DRRRGAAVRLLPVGADPGGGSDAPAQAAPDRRRHRRDHDQPVPLRHLSAHPPRDPPRRRGGQGRRPVMISRRRVLAAGLASGAGLALGFHLVRRGEPVPSGPPLTPNVWLSIGEDDVVTITVAKAEMGQGVLTSLAMLVAEELEADWSRV